MFLIFLANAAYVVIAIHLVTAIIPANVIIPANATHPAIATQPTVAETDIKNKGRNFCFCPLFYTSREIIGLSSLTPQTTRILAPSGASALISSVFLPGFKVIIPDAENASVISPFVPEAYHDGNV